MGHGMGGELGERAGELLRYFARLVADELRGGDISLVSQSTSPLGARRHNAAVRRRIAEHARGELAISGASIVGRRHMLTQEAVAEEMGRREKGPALAKAKRRATAATEASDEQSTYDAVMGRYRRPQ